MNDPMLNVIDDLMAAFGETRWKRLAMPPGKRDAVIAMLTRGVVDPLFEAEYGDYLDDRIRQDRVGKALNSLSVDPLPREEVAASGFAELSDDTLAILAVNKGDYSGLVKFVRLADMRKKPAMGPWLSDAKALYHPPLDLQVPRFWKQFLRDLRTHDYIIACTEVSFRFRPEEEGES